MDTKRFALKWIRMGALCAIWALIASGAALAAPMPGDVLPAVELPKPASAAELAYLGLSGPGSFALTDIKAKIVIVEFYSMYCPYCQAEAPNTVKLYNDIENDPKLKGTIKLIGVAVGNSDSERDLFREKYAIPFPLFSDGDFTTVKQLGLRFTPHFVVVRIDEKGKAHVLYSKPGSIGDPKEFIKTITGD